MPSWRKEQVQRTRLQPDYHQCSRQQYLVDETVLRVDGGMTASDWTMQCLADILDAPVDRPEVLETTALGAGYLAGMQVGLYPSFEQFSDSWSLARRFNPTMAPDSREQKCAGWTDAVRRTLT